MRLESGYIWQALNVFNSWNRSAQIILGRVFAPRHPCRSLGQPESALELVVGSQCAVSWVTPARPCLKAFWFAGGPDLPGIPAMGKPL